MKTACPKCKSALNFDENKVKQKIVKLKCAVCSQLFEVDVDALKQQENELLKLLENCYISVRLKDGETQQYKLKTGKNIIGRKSQSLLIDIAVETDDLEMSREHAALDVVINKYGKLDFLLSDHKSKNGTFILVGSTPKRVEKETYAVLHPNDQFLLGNTAFSLHIQIPTEQPIRNINQPWDADKTMLD